MTCYFSPLILLLTITILSVNLSGAAELDSAKTVLLDSIETVLRADYQHCTEDSSVISFDDLMKWRKGIDSVLTRQDYAALALSYQKETGLSAATARPCEIIAWIKQCELKLQEYGELLEQSSISINKEKNDSLFLDNELKILTSNNYDLAGIPFQLSIRSFYLLTKKQRFPEPVEESGFVRYDSLLYGIHPFRVAFHFSRDSLYWSYEIESASCSIDSLEVWARPMMLYLSSEFEKRCGVPPNHLYRVGHFDIVPGRLSIVRMWNFPKANCYIGLARKGNRFYAKAIVQCR